MNNPFGISDDLMTAAIVAAMKERSAQQQKNSKPENPFNVDTVAMAKKSAKTTKQLYDAYVEGYLDRKEKLITERLNR